MFKTSFFIDKILFKINFDLRLTCLNLISNSHIFANDWGFACTSQEASETTCTKTDIFEVHLGLTLVDGIWMWLIVTMLWFFAGELLSLFLLLSFVLEVLLVLLLLLALEEVGICLKLAVALFLEFLLVSALRTVELLYSWLVFFVLADTKGMYALLPLDGDHAFFYLQLLLSFVRFSLQNLGRQEVPPIRASSTFVHAALCVKLLLGHQWLNLPVWHCLSANSF